MRSVGPLLPEAYDLAWVLAVLVPIALVAVAVVVLVVVIRRAVAAGVRDAAAVRRADD